jgi:hypothetical protein
MLPDAKFISLLAFSFACLSSLEQSKIKKASNNVRVILNKIERYIDGYFPIGLPAGGMGVGTWLFIGGKLCK